MNRNNFEDEYFERLCHVVSVRESVSYNKLLSFLHNTEFKYVIPKDRNRASDGICLRVRFGDSVPYDYPCSVLEMMVALAIRCETTIMDNAEIGDRTSQWFWNMIVNLGLGHMTDDRFDEDYVRDVVDKFLYREYEPDGTGGLFRIRNCEYDLRDVEIWYQMCWYLDTIA